MKLLPLAIIAAAVISGCQTKQLQEMTYSEQKELFAELHSSCQKQGVKEGSDEMKLCIQQELNREAYERHQNAQDRANASKVFSALGGAMQGYGNGIQANRSMRCTSTPFSGNVGGPVRSVTTSCY